MRNDKPLAHSARLGYPKQLYESHVAGVSQVGTQNAKNVFEFLVGRDKQHFVDAVTNATTMHDLGKLDELNQHVLNKVGGKKSRLPINHVDASVAQLLDLKQNEPAILVAAHHRGLFSDKEESNKPDHLAFRDTAYSDELGCPVYKRVDSLLREYVDVHARSGCQAVRPLETPIESFDGLTNGLLFHVLSTVTITILRGITGMKVIYRELKRDGVIASTHLTVM